MSAREAKNQAMKRFNTIDDLVNVNSDIEVNQKVKEEINNNINSDIINESDIEVDRISVLKAKMQEGKKKESNKQVTVYLTPKNYKRFNALKEKGQKSELINQLLDLYFDE